MQRNPLEGVRVVDFSWVLAGPLTCRHLATMGAEVIKIESMGRLDSSRTNRPFLKGEPGPDRTGMYPQVNYSKKSCTLNLRDPRALEIAKKLIKISDVMVQNYATGVIDRMGLGYPVVKELNPSIIMASSSGLGGTGPLKYAVTYGTNLHAFSGLSGATGYAGGKPRGVGGTWADPVTSALMAFAIVSALHYRAKTGKGQYLDMAMAEAVTGTLPEVVMEYTMNQRVLGPSSNYDDVAVPHNCYRCKGDDKWVAIVVSNEEEWQALCKATGHPEWANDERFADAYLRSKHQEELDKLITQWTKNYTHYEAMEILQKAGVPAGASVTTEEMMNDPNLNARGFFKEMEHPLAGKIRVMATPWKMSASDGYYHRSSLLGEDNEYVLAELLGMPKSEIDVLVKEQVIY